MLGANRFAIPVNTAKASFPLQPYRSIFFCVEVISSTLPLRKQRNTLRFGTIQVENWLKVFHELKTHQG